MTETIPIVIDFQKKVPLTEQIASGLRQLIHAGRLKPGQPLPTVRELAFQLRVNFNTVARAYRILDMEGLLITWQGRGTFVEQGKPNYGQDQLPDETPAQRLIQQLFKQAEAQGISPQDIHAAFEDHVAAVTSTAPRKIRPASRKYRNAANAQPVAQKTGSMITLRRVRRNSYIRHPRRIDP